MRRGLVSLLAVVFLAVPVVSDAATTPALTLRTFAIGGFGIGVPAGWGNELLTTPVALKAETLSMADLAEQLSAASPAKAILGLPGESSVQFEVDVVRAPGVTAALLAHRWQTKLQQSLGAGASVTLTPVGLGVGIAYKVHSIGDDGTLGVEESDRYFLVNDRIEYVFNALAPPLSWAQYAPTFARIAKSFRLLAAPNLGGLELLKSEVGPGYSSRVVPNGKAFIGVPTLDLCAATYPSDNLRTGRLQMVYASPDQTQPVVQNEIATYVPGGGLVALSEVKAEAKACSKTPVHLQDGKGDTAVVKATMLSDPKLLPGSVAVREDQVITGGGTSVSTTTFAIYQVANDTLSGIYVTANDPNYPLVSIATAERAALHAAEQSGRNISGRTLVL